MERQNKDIFIHMNIWKIYYPKTLTEKTTLGCTLARKKKKVNLKEGCKKPQWANKYIVVNIYIVVNQNE